MKSVKSCPTCKFENDSTRTTCERCGASLVAVLPSKSTVPVPENLLKSPPPIANVTPKIHDDSVAIYLIGQPQPVIVPKDVRKITFGRFAPGESTPTVDLTPFDAHLFGVSRMHATLHRSENACYVQDLESTNGSWINDNRLTPQKLYEVMSGDLIRLGQLGMRIYFETNNTETTLYLTDEEASGQQMTPAYLETRITPYLNAFTTVQQTLDVVSERPVSAINLRKIESDGKGHLTIQFTGGRDCVRLLEKQLAEWRTPRQILIERVRVLNAKNKTLKSDEIKTQLEPLTADLRGQLADFARTTVMQMGAGLAETVRQTYADKLLAPLYALVTNPLQIAQDESNTEPAPPV